MTIHALIIFNTNRVGSYDEVRRFDSPEHLRMFREGYQCAAGGYDTNSWAIWTLADLDIPVEPARRIPDDIAARVRERLKDTL